MWIVFSITQDYGILGEWFVIFLNFLEGPNIQE